MSENFQPVCKVDEIQPRKFGIFEVEGRSVVICNVKGEFFAVENQCSHAMATFEEGRLRGCRLMCPLHGATFDVRDGSVKGAPATRPIRSYPCRVVDDCVEVAVEG